MRNKFVREGMSMAKAKAKAAKIWNSRHSGKEAVGRYSK